MKSKHKIGIFGHNSRLPIDIPRNKILFGRLHNLLDLTGPKSFPDNPKNTLYSYFQIKSGHHDTANIISILMVSVKVSDAT